MASTYIATTSRGDFNAMRYQGILVTDSYAQLVSMLDKKLSREHSLFFAEPVHDASGVTTDWYTEAEGTPVPLSELPPEEQQKALVKISSLAKDINGQADSLKNSEKSSESIRGNILALALRLPGKEHIYMVGDQPVLTCWGFTPGTIGAQPEDLMRLGAALPVTGMRSTEPAATEATEHGAAPRSVSPVAVPGTTSPFPWWRALLAFLLGLLLLTALFFLAGLLFGPAGCVTPGMLPPGCSAQSLPLPGGCSPVAPAVGEEPLQDKPLVASLTAEQEKERTLRRQLEDLRRQLEARAAQCVRTPPAVPEPPVVTPPVLEPPKEPPVEEKEEPVEPPSLADLMPTTPDPVEAPAVVPEEKPKPAPKPEAKPQKQAKGEDLRIPESARKNKDVSFLEGCWDSDPGLANDRTGEPLDVKYCFDANGRGKRTVTGRRSKERCVGSVRASFDALGNLIINADGAPCDKGGAYVPQDVQCTQTGGGKAGCYGQERGGRRNKWDAQFRRG